jgi:hypothetical protein
MLIDLTAGKILCYDPDKSIIGQKCQKKLISAVWILIWYDPAFWNESEKLVLFNFYAQILHM